MERLGGMKWENSEILDFVHRKYHSDIGIEIWTQHDRPIDFTDTKTPWMLYLIAAKYLMLHKKYTMEKNVLFAVV